jgi:predicted nuclease of restriction endonuclease-like RecB superfamily
MFDKYAAEKAFDEFLVKMDDQLEWLADEAEKYETSLDFTVDDLARLERLFDSMAENHDEHYASKLVIIFARHLGEFFRKNYGGKWSLHLADEKNVNFNTPVIAGYSKIEGLEFAPVSVMRAYNLRRKQGTLYRAVDANANPSALDLSRFIEN